MNVVFFSPEDLSIIKNGPAERRHFVDMELCQLDAGYLYNLNHYNRIVNPVSYTHLDVYKRQAFLSYGNEVSYTMKKNRQR